MIVWSLVQQEECVVCVCVYMMVAARSGAFQCVMCPLCWCFPSCPVVGCGNLDVKQSDLVPDQLLRRRIQSQKRQGTRT